MYTIIIKEQNTFINDNSIILVYDIEERGIEKFVKLIENAQYIQNIEPTNKSKQKDNYFTITTTTDYSKPVKEVTGMVKHFYPDRSDR